MEYIIVDQSDNSSIKYNRGVFLLTEYSIDYSTSSYTISLKLNDQVSMFNGDISGTLGEYGAITTIIPASDCDTVRDAMLYVCELGGITEYIIGDANKDFPYDKLAQYASSMEDITKSLDKIFNNLVMDCRSCNLKPVCDEVEGMRELHKRLEVK